MEFLTKYEKLESVEENLLLTMLDQYEEDQDKLIWNEDLQIRLKR